MTALAPVASAPPVARMPWHWRLREAVSNYLPLLLMALLALGTWWLVKNTPQPSTASDAAPVRRDADYTMHQFVVQRFTAEGRLRVQIEGDELRHYPDSDSMEIDNVRLRSLDADGRVTRATARLARANSDASELQLEGGAQVVREGLVGELPIEFRGEFLQAYSNTERVKSHLPVVVRQGATEMRGDALDYDNLARVLQLQGHVHASFPAASAKPRPKP